ncbi:sensor histidine kinase [Ornithinibacillus bavariensis]|uniref:histidine kinase n=1 Tax=Ornithinibacillus bavariensis TaxID=545502 RepID=A0A919X9N1_9BACI|nr:HAMP domain-containing sensor histidine kinase [Ornithinibacillus bavariensis]GIO27060.1 two-component sensor histidine kinase [Ornithinibacillus bavariensis]HAM80133.1 sensor histidine kinase [Ornithinibacillus sp.]
MKKLRWRLFLNFLLQFILIAASMLLVILFTLIFAVLFFTQNYSQHNYYQAMIEAISMDTGNSFTELEMTDGWDKNLSKDNVWVQIINEDGHVIDSGNVPSNIPKFYSHNDLITLKESKELYGYSLVFYLETTYKDNYLFILGYEDRANQLLHQIVQNYGRAGYISDKDVPYVQAILEKNEGKLEIYDSSDTLQLTIGEDIDSGKPIDVFVRDEYPDTFSTKETTYQDPDSGVLWVLYTPNENNKEIEFNEARNVLIAFAVTAFIVLFITILVSIWNGFRYGNPLFIFTNFLSRLGDEQYEEVLTSREKKQIFKRNGKVKFRYRLYKEVFQAFYTMAEKLNSSKKERELLEKSREEWMVGISHDLRTPLTTMQGYGKLLENEGYDWTKEELTEIGKTINDKSEYMVRLIEDFTLSFHLKNDNNHFLFESVELNAFLKAITEKYFNDRTIEDYAINVHLLNYEVYLSMNKRLFERMMDNLIYNAIKHNPKNTTIDIHVVDVTESDQIMITISDNGVGMDESTKQHLFDRFYRGTNTDERVEGTGLGMSIALQIAKLHKGDFQVESEENEGTTISVSLPIE